MTQMTQMTHIQSRMGARAPRFSVARLLQVARQRRVLARLDDVALADIGLTRKEALAEARRPFWDIDR